MQKKKLRSAEFKMQMELNFSEPHIKATSVESLVIFIADAEVRLADGLHRRPTPTHLRALSSHSI